MRIEIAGSGIDFVPWTPRTGRAFEKAYAIECATAEVDDRRPWLTPPFVLGAACDGRRGHLIARGHAPAFLAAHADVPVAMHDAPLALASLNLLAPALDVYRLVDEDLVWDARLLHRLHCLATGGHTASGPGESTLGRCARLYLGVDLLEDVVDPRGEEVRGSYGRWLGGDPRAIEPCYLGLAARRAVVTYRVFRLLRKRLLADLVAAGECWGYVSDDWLVAQFLRWGPATHHIQLKAEVVLREVSANGLHLDASRREAALADVRAAAAGPGATLRGRGYLAGQKGSARALESILRRIEAGIPGVELVRTTDGRISTSEEALAALAAVDPFARALLDHAGMRRLESAFLAKLARPVIHPSFDVLKTTGRTSSFGELNAQGLPRDPRVRRCIVPRPGHLLFVGDYKAIEMATLAQGVLTQWGLDSRLAEALNAGRDPHRMVAALATGTAESEVTDRGREKAKPINFGKPGAMGHDALKAYALAVYGLALSDDEVRALSDAWFGLFPEMRTFLAGEAGTLEDVARFFGLTPDSHRDHAGRRGPLDHPDSDARGDRPSPALGGMCVKALGASSPTTRGGEPYDPDMLDYLWERVEGRLADLPATLHGQVRGRRPSRALQRAVLGLIGRAPVLTATGRLRAGAGFAARHNTIFQGLAADGAKLALWLVWRAGYRVVNFVHDELVVELPAGPGAAAEARHLAALMVAAMREVVPDVRVAVEYCLAGSYDTGGDRIGATGEVASDDPDFAALAGPAPDGARQGIAFQE